MGSKASRESLGDVMFYMIINILYDLFTFIIKYVVIVYE